MTPALLAFAVLAVLAVASAVVVITHRNPVVCALALAFNLVSIAGFYFLLDAQFIALLQVIVYAGAIMVLILFAVLIADDQALVRSGLRLVLEARGVVVVGEAADGGEAVELVEQLRPEVVLMDIQMPVLDGITATRRIVGSGSPSRVIVLTTYDLDRYVYDSLKAGASGFLLKASPPDRLVEGIETVAGGEALLAPALTRRLIEDHVRRPAPYDGPPPPLAALTERELEVFGLIARGRSNDEIAASLVVSQATVKTHVNRILAKLQLQSRVQAVVLGYECGLVIPGGMSGASEP